MATATTHLRDTRPNTRSYDLTRALPLIGRTLFAAIFLMSTPSHFSPRSVEYAASQGLPFASIMVPLAGIIALLGGLSVVLGYKTKVGAWLLIVFLLPVTLVMHRFWTATDPQMVEMQTIQFMKNLALIGGALFLAYFGAGPLSVDARIARIASRRYYTT